MVTAIDSPVRQTFVGELVGPDLLPNAVGLNSASINAARLIGPGISGVLIAVVGAGWVFMINGTTFAATILALTFMNSATLYPLPHVGKRKGEIRESLHYLRGRQDLLVIFFRMGVISMFGLNFQITNALMTRVQFGHGASEFGLAGSVMAIGSLAGALLAARRDRPRIRLILGAGFGSAFATALLAVQPTYVTFLVFLVPVGLASLTMMTAANATIQTTTEPAMRGRMMALYMMIFQGSTPLGAPLIGWIGQHLGPRWAIAVGAIAVFIACTLATIWAFRHWHLEIKLYHRAVTYTSTPSRWVPLRQRRPNWQRLCCSRNM